MNSDEREFMNELDRRQQEANNINTHWRVSGEEFDRAFDLGRRSWSRVMLNYHRFTQHDFYNFNFREADLDGCIFENMNLRSVSFDGASLHEAYFKDCNLSEVGWSRTDLTRTKFINCDLSGIGLDQINIRCVTGLKVVGPVGRAGRNIVGYVYDGEIRIQAGCRNDKSNGIRAAVREEYAYDLMNQADYYDAIKLLEAWGKREIKRLKG